jgi:hypothetical protein
MWSRGEVKWDLLRIWSRAEVEWELLGIWSRAEVARHVEESGS